MPTISHRDTEPGKASARYATPENHAYFCPTPGEITRLAVTPNIIGHIPNGKELYAELKNCGFNAAAIFIGKVANAELNKDSSLSNTIRFSKDCGISLFIQTDTITNRMPLMKQLVKYFADCTKLVGWWMLTPTYSEIDSDGKSNLAYNEIFTFENETPGASQQNHHMVFMNAYASVEGAGTDNYRNYLTKFQNNIKPSIWGAAVYPAATSASGEILNDYDLFFRNLQIMSLISRYCERPFWAYVMCQSYRGPDGYSTAYPTLEEMRFSALSALAYGAQGLEFWSYRLRANEIQDGEI